MSTDNTITHGNNEYEIGPKVAEAENFRLYLCNHRSIEPEKENRQCLLQIASDIGHNGDLQRTASLLLRLKRHSDLLEEEYGKIKPDPRIFLNYQLGFPALIDSFTDEEQGNRQINILAFRNVEQIADMAPLVNITEVDNERIDRRTSAWIMGKLLKLLGFIHNQGLSVNMSGDNILIDAKQHYVVIFDWTQTQVFEDGRVPFDIQRRDIAQTASAVISAMGGDAKTGFFPEDNNDFDEKVYLEYLVGLAHEKVRLVDGDDVFADIMVSDFYTIVDRTWPRGFYPYATKPLEKSSGEAHEEKEGTEE